MSNSFKTPSLLTNAHSVASVSSTAPSYGSRSVARLVQGAALVACFTAAALGAAPAAAQSYQPANQYQVSTTDKIHATVVNVSTYRDRQDNRPSDFERRQTNAQSQARRRTSNLIGSIVNSAVGDALGGGSNRYTRNMANIGGDYAGAIARGVVDTGTRSRVNSDGWSGNVRVMSEAMSLVTLDVQYPGNRTERIQVRQPQGMSEGLNRGDAVTLELSIDPRTNQQVFVAVETPASRARDRYRR